MILSGIAAPTPWIQAICVKFIFIRSIIGEEFQTDNLPHMAILGDDEVAAMNKQNNITENLSTRDVLQDIDFEIIDNCSYVATFKIYQQTMFDEVKLSACEFWDLSHANEDFILTDEYFNNLASYKDTIQNFFA
mmetsp:Transcript_5847/g.9391  ORF Transcript_5847/g.9391 Transcript_5847/m.9391 type:complete len:134 (-) Transcript_5847:2079-2480(-)